ncbi:unnamed protein product [Peronospora belbahrii]|uniref:PNPLA domain-containing protein n=1 Tax=Peronospora belbahrii TaxID=622444 RepID=A0AAU9L7P8_9STRA|nr:unnamed protein product [Peronospora belbahrii]
MKTEKHTSWESLEDLTGSIMTSSLVPFALSGKPCISHRGQWYIDGAFTNFKGVDCDEYSTFADLSFHIAQTVLQSVRSASTALVGYLIPGTWALPSADGSAATQERSPRAVAARLTFKRCGNELTYCPSTGHQSLCSRDERFNFQPIVATLLQRSTASINATPAQQQRHREGGLLLFK